MKVGELEKFKYYELYKCALLLCGIEESAIPVYLGNLNTDDSGIYSHDLVPDVDTWCRALVHGIRNNEIIPANKDQLISLYNTTELAPARAYCLSIYDLKKWLSEYHPSFDTSVLKTLNPGGDTGFDVKSTKKNKTPSTSDTKLDEESRKKLKSKIAALEKENNNSCALIFAVLHYVTEVSNSYNMNKLIENMEGHYKREIPGLSRSTINRKYKKGKEFLIDLDIIL